MGLFDKFFGDGKRVVILDAAVLERWPERLVRQQLLHDHFDEYVERIAKEREKIVRLKARVADPSLKEQHPDRVSGIIEEHGQLMGNALQHLLNATSMIKDLFLVEQQQEDFRNALDRYRGRTEKSRSALREFIEGELRELDHAIRSLEDAMMSITPILEEKRFDNIKRAKAIIEEYKGSRSKEQKVKELQTRLQKELEALEEKRLKHKEKIKYFSERARNSKFKELIAEEEDLLEKVDEIKVQNLAPEEEEKRLSPLLQRLTWLRKQMINDITAMNINEQRTFLEATKDDIRLRRRKLERIEEILQELSWNAYRQRLIEAMEPFDVRIEDVGSIIDRGEEDVAPQ